MNNSIICPSLRGETVRAITLWQPWASLVAMGFKQYETRSWPTSYRGKILIHAAKRSISYQKIEWILAKVPLDERSFDVYRALQLTSLPLGCVVAIADLVECCEMDDDKTFNKVNVSHPQISINSISRLEQAVGDWSLGRFAWKLSGVRALTNLVPASGKQGLWIPSSELIEQIEGAIVSSEVTA